MADNKLRVKAMNNTWAGYGWYAPNQGDIEASPENAQVSTAQKPNYRRKHILSGKARHRIAGR